MQKVVLNKNRVMEYARSFKGEKYIEFPELREFLGYAEDKVPVLLIKAASLDNHIRVNSIIERSTIKAIKMIEGAKRGDFKEVFDVESIKHELESPILEKTSIEISIFHSCVVKPKFTMREAVLISMSMPEVVNRVAKEALNMSSLENIKWQSKKKSMS